MNATCFAATFAVILIASTVHAASKDLGNGFIDHGVATPISNHRGTVATTDGNGHNVLLSLLSDHRGGYELLLLDTVTQKAEQFPIPFDNTELGDYPYSSILSRENKFYTHFGNYFVEFDPVQRKFTFSQKTEPQMAMSMTEDDAGVIWSCTYPDSGVVSFNSKTREFKDFGHVHKENWPQYPRNVAVDDTGVVYFGIGATTCQIVAFDPKTKDATPILPESDRQQGYAYVYRDRDGKCYGRAMNDTNKDNWYRLYQGKGEKIGKHDTVNSVPCITGSQGLEHYDFPDGSKVTKYDLIERKFAWHDATSNTTKEFAFNYDTEGAVIMGAAYCPDHSIVGGTSFPFRSFRYDPKTDQLLNRTAMWQWNATTHQDDHFFVGGYPHGFLLDYDVSKPFVTTEKDNRNSNPLLVIPECGPTIYRPDVLFAHPDGHTIVMGGTPDYGYTGGGLCFWDRNTKTRALLTDREVIPDQSTISLVALPHDQLLGGSTTNPGSGGEKKATEAQLYIMDFASKKIGWTGAIIPGTQEYTALHAGPTERAVFGVADRKTFFVFDPEQKKIVHQEALPGECVMLQGPRVFVDSPDGRTFILLDKGVAAINPKTYEVTLIVSSPIKLEGGGDYLDGRIYFTKGSHLYSVAVPAQNNRVSN